MDSNSSSAGAIVAPDLDTLAMQEQQHNRTYKEEIWNCLLQRDAEKPPFHLQSPQLAFRGTLVHKIRSVAKSLDLSITTLHSAVALLDLFMDAHKLRSDRLTHVALACLSLAAKVEEDVVTAPSLPTLSIASNVKLYGKSFRQIEWVVGQHVQWRLLTPTPVTYAALLAELVVTDGDYVVENDRKLANKLRIEGAQKIDEYLDLTLSDVRLKAVDSVIVGCACVSCARQDMELNPWTFQLRMVTRKQYVDIAPITRRLHKMMKMLKARRKRTHEDDQIDLGYASAKSTPNLTPNTSPSFEFRHLTTNFFTNYRDKVNQVKTLQEELRNSQAENPRSDVCIIKDHITPTVEPSTSTNRILQEMHESESSSDSSSISEDAVVDDDLSTASEDEDETVIIKSIKRPRICDWKPQ